ncbi:hypothetical protein HDV06_002514 [Boothiomyces sp. JEL0866]|nr:hypothetical protein HDV06_002514 [Boothiomyces sp. JEL0866]
MIAYIAGISTSLLLMNIIGAILRLRQLRSMDTKILFDKLLVITTISLGVFTTNYSLLNTVEKGSITSKGCYYLSRITYSVFCASQTSMNTIKYLQVVKNKKHRELLDYSTLALNFGMMLFGIIGGCIEVTLANSLPPEISIFTKIPTFYYAASSVIIGILVFLVKLIKSAMIADLEISLFGQIGANWKMWVIVILGNVSVLSQTIGWFIILWNSFANNGSVWLGSISSACLNAIFFVENGSAVIIGELCKNGKDKPVQSPNRSAHHPDLETPS